MPLAYKISGTLSAAARIIVIKESDWSIESNTTESIGSYEITGLVSGAKLSMARKSDGETLIYGSLTPVSYLAQGDRGLFGGGYDGNNLDTIDYITISTTSDATDFGNLTQARGLLGGTSNGAADRGVFNGGTQVNTIDYITISVIGNATNFGDLTSAWRYHVTSTSNGTSDRGVNMGGYSYTNVIDYITISSAGNATDFGDLDETLAGVASCSNATNDRGVGAGGKKSSVYNTIQYITISSIGDATDFGDLTSSRYAMGSCSNGTNNRGIFVGDSGETNLIEYITITSLGNSADFGDLTVARQYAEGATSNGTNNRGVFAGSEISYQEQNIIDYITISSIGDATDFGDLSIKRGRVAGCSNA